MSSLDFKKHFKEAHSLFTNKQLFPFNFFFRMFSYQRYFEQKNCFRFFFFSSQLANAAHVNLMAFLFYFETLINEIMELEYKRLVGIILYASLQHTSLMQMVTICFLHDCFQIKSKLLYWYLLLLYIILVDYSKSSKSLTQYFLDSHKVTHTHTLFLRI